MPAPEVVRVLRDGQVYHINREWLEPGEVPMAEAEAAAAPAPGASSEAGAKSAGSADTAGAPTAEELMKKTVAELAAYAKERGVAVRSGTTKAELVAAIVAQG